MNWARGLKRWNYHSEGIDQDHWGVLQLSSQVSDRLTTNRDQHIVAFWFRDKTEQLTITTAKDIHTKIHKKFLFQIQWFCVSKGGQIANHFENGLFKSLSQQWVHRGCIQKRPTKGHSSKRFCFPCKIRSQERFWRKVWKVWLQNIKLQIHVCAQ